MPGCPRSIRCFEQIGLAHRVWRRCLWEGVVWEGRRGPRGVEGSRGVHGAHGSRVRPRGRPAPPYERRVGDRCGFADRREHGAIALHRKLHRTFDTVAVQVTAADREAQLDPAKCPRCIGLLVAVDAHVDRRHVLALLAEDFDEVARGAAGPGDQLQLRGAWTRGRPVRAAVERDRVGLAGCFECDAGTAVAGGLEAGGGGRRRDADTDGGANGGTQPLGCRGGGEARGGAAIPTGRPLARRGEDRSSSSHGAPTTASWLPRCSRTCARRLVCDPEGLPGGRSSFGPHPTAAHPGVERASSMTHRTTPRVPATAQPAGEARNSPTAHEAEDRHPAPKRGRVSPPPPAGPAHAAGSPSTRATARRRSRYLRRAREMALGTPQGGGDVRRCEFARGDTGQSQRPTLLDNGSRDRLHDRRLATSLNGWP